MKRILFSSVAAAAVVALAGVANAADLPRQMVTKAPAAYAPVYNWTGMYIGLNGGGGWGKSSWSSPSSGDFDVSGWMVGGTLGYNWQMGQFVVGLEGDLDWANIKGTATNAACPLGCTTENTWLGTVRGRVGYAFDRFMPYITGGLAVGDVKASYPGFPGASSTQAGWTIGGGLEFAFAPNWTAKAEYLYVDLGDFNCGTNCGGVSPDTVSFTSNIVRGGVNYRF